jgi:DNA invertase Pin-like site-specific DNA recombinase
MKINLKFVAYFRVSTRKQEVSGLGLDAQRTMVDRFLPAGAQVVAEFIEIETGKNARRPQLAAALKLARESGAVLIVAKLDRLARNVSFTSALMDSGVEFVCCDCPYASRLTLHILAAVAEDEARRISDRTKAALAELKTQGVLLGGANPIIREKSAGRTGWANMDPAKRDLVKKYRLEDTYGDIIPLIRVLRDLEKTNQEIADTLTTQGFSTPRGAKHSATSVRRILEREGSLV